MKHPLWILNSALLLLVLITFWFVFLSRQKPPRRESLEVEGAAKPIKEESLKINISQIYENDLFGTYQKEMPEVKQPSFVGALPEPPTPQRVTAPETPPPQFLEPLNISLKGVIFFINNDDKNRAIIADNKTNREATYKVGDIIEDAQLIRILNNKVMFLRSNGQQEVLYLREKDAQQDPAYLAINQWESVVKKTDNNNFLISPSEFADKIKNLSQFIDMLNLTTVYKQSALFGCRIGKLTDKSIGTEIGLQSGDIILTINDIPTTDTPNRFKIYQKIVVMQQNDVIRVKLLRSNQEQELLYTLQDFRPKETGSKQGVPTTPSSAFTSRPAPSAQEMRNEQMRMMQERYKFAPTVEEIRAQEKRNMFNRGKAPVRNVTNTMTE